MRRKCDNAYPCWIKKDRITVAAKKIPPAIMATHTSSCAGILNTVRCSMKENTSARTGVVRLGPKTAVVLSERGNCLA